MSDPKKKLFLLDAYALIYRAHFAFSKNPRISSKGVNTGVMFGFTNTLLDILFNQKPTHIGVAFDTAAPTFRHDEFKEYKANRQETPEDIRAGIPVVKKIIEGFNIPILEKDGFEADDIIGTLAGQASSKGFEVFMMTPDKDFGQLVEEHVYLYKPSYMGNSVDILGVDEVLKKWDIEKVSQVTDMLGLQGDSSDNIPGIPGVGPKTASKLIKEYGSVEALVKNTDGLKGKLKATIEEFGEQGILSKKLATIITDVPVDFDEAALEYHGPDEKKLRPVFEDLEFRTIIGRVFGSSGTKTIAPANPQLSMFDTVSAPVVEPQTETKPIEKSNIENSDKKYHLVDSPELRRELAGFLALQDEFYFGTVLNGDFALEAGLAGLSFCYLTNEAYFVPLPEDEKTEDLLEDFREVLENESIAKIGYNVKQDILLLKRYGMTLKGASFDIMLAHYLIEPEVRHDPDILADTYLDYHTLSLDMLAEEGQKVKKVSDLPWNKAKEYVGEMADVGFQVNDFLRKELDSKNQEKLMREVEFPLVQVLADMEFEGVTVDLDTLGEMSEEMESLSNDLQRQIFEFCGEEFNINSPKQLGEVLFERLKLIEKPKKTKSGQYATGEEILSKLALEHEVVQKILDFREYQKLKSTYIDALPNLINPWDGRIHTDYNQARAATGRLSSNNPNLQNIPIRTEKGRAIRKAFVPRSEDYQLLSADYSQIELRIAADFAKDEQMTEAFKKGQDIHATTASRVFQVPLKQVDPNMRRKAKEVNFGLIYGMSAFGLADRLNIPRSEARDIMEAYFTQFSAVKKYMDRIINEAKEHEYVETILGRRRYLRDINSRNATTRGYAERNAINAPIQGSAADIIKIAMINIHQWMAESNLQSRMIMQVHDELVFDIHKDEIDVVKPKVIQLMKEASPLEVPMDVEAGIGKDWLEAH